MLAYFVAAASPNMDVANAVLPIYVTTLLFFGGFLQDFETMPQWWKWFSYIDFVRYSWGALMMNQFAAKDPIWQNGKTVLENYHLKNYDGDSYEIAGPAGRTHYSWYTQNVRMYDNVGFMVVFFLVYLLLAWYTLATKNFVKR